MTRALTAAAAALIVLLATPLLAAAILISTTAPAAQAAACHPDALPATGSWRAPYEQAYAVGARGFGMRWHPILGRYRMHAGQDLSALPSPGPVVAVAAGTITTATYSSGYGNHVIIDHGAATASLYAHLAHLAPGITPGATVHIGQHLGTEGSTGLSTGNHLHFEIRQDNTPIDPVAFMLARGAPLNGTATAPSTPTPPDPLAAADLTGLTGLTGGTGEGGIGFPLPAPGEPRLASLTNPALPIPAPVKALYQRAAETYQLPWTILAGIGMAETAHGATTATSSAGAQGLMQFMPATFAQYGTDGDGDGHADITNDADSITSAANYLTASGITTGGPEGVKAALFAYNRATWYVNDVLTYAHAYGGGTILADPTSCPTGPTQPAGPALTPDQIHTVLTWATSRTGDPYQLGATGPHAWDCSSFTQSAYAQIGLTLPRTAAAQRAWLAAGNGTPIPPGQEQPGDLIFIDSYLGPHQIGHVMVVHDPHTTTTIEAGTRGVGHYDYTRRQNTTTIFEIWRPSTPTR